jgi:hypothetical protein
MSKKFGMNWGDGREDSGERREGDVGWRGDVG